MVGHTSDSAIRKHHLDGSFDLNDGDLCIDCHLSQYLIINNGKLTVKKYIDL